ncbi:MAG: hypothetical protein K6A36_00840 [Paludibacteraceae bacterium]|nr:hypothetical protein [Paludibacteraceae bacterium]
MAQDNKSEHIVATIGTAIFLILLFLLLWYVYIDAVKEPEEEGVEVAFGDVDNAGGYMPDETQSMPSPVEETAAPPVATAPSDNDLMTQEDEEALALRKQQEKEKKERQQAEAERLRKQREEQARIEKERKEKEAAEAAKKAKEDAAKAKAQNLIGGMFGQGSGQGHTGNSGGEGSGDGHGAGTQGNPIGHGSSGGASWSLGGRGLRGTLPQPSNNFNQAGKVVVQIRVNAAGQVVEARETTGTNISDKATIQLAIEAAKKAKFTEGDHDQVGTITYNFKFN